MNLTVVILCAAIAACIFGSNFFSSAEMSYSSANQVRLEHEAEDGSKAAKIALYITGHFDNALSAILIGNNLVNIAASSLTSVFVLLVTGSDAYTWVGTAVVTVLIIIFGETIAKITAKKKPNTLAFRYAYVIRFLMILFFPLIWIVVKATNFITGFIKAPENEDEDEAVESFQSMIEAAEDEGILDSDDTELLQAAIDFSDISASEVMTSRVDMDAIDIEDSLEEVLELLEKSGHSRIPVYEDGIDHVIGILHANHLLKALCEDQEVSLRSLLLPVCYVYKTMKLPDVLDQFQRAKQQLAIVTDEYGGTLGVITMEDVMEELVGEIWDESDEVEQDFLAKGSNRFEVDGDMGTKDFLELIGSSSEADDYDSETVGGLCIETLGHYPKKDESFVFENVRIRVLSMDDRRVEKLLVEAETVL